MTLTARQKRIRAAAKARRLQPRKNCPHPGKVAYKDQAAIPVALRRSKASGKAMRIYTCACGALHLTSKPEGRRSQSLGSKSMTDSTRPAKS